MTNKDNTLVLFVNDNKTQEKQPDYRGKATVGGVEYKCAGWKQIGKNTGTVYLSVKLEEVQDEQSAPLPPPKPKPRPADEDEIPF